MDKAHLIVVMLLLARFTKHIGVIDHGKHDQSRGTVFALFKSEDQQGIGFGFIIQQPGMMQPDIKRDDRAVAFNVGFFNPAMLMFFALGIHPDAFVVFPSLNEIVDILEIR